MFPPITDKTVCIASNKVVIREILDDTIIVPLENGVGSSSDEFFTLNHSGNALLRYFDGRQTLGEIAIELADQYTSPKETILVDIIEFCTEMVKRQILAVKD
jgi:hypothetical protein